MKSFEGELKGAGLKPAIVVSRFNSLITSKLLTGAQDGLVRHGVADNDIDVVWVPGAFEIPMVTRRLAQAGRYDLVICLGAVIRGETPHFDYVAAEVSKGVAAVALHSEIPVVFGVLTTDSVEQALDRAGAKAGNKGFEAAMSALEMANLLPKLLRPQD